MSADSNKYNTGKVFLTSCRDTVYGGDGIMPSVFVPLDTSTLQQKMNHIYTGNGLNNATYNYYLKHKPEITGFKSAADYNQQFNKADEIWQGFLNDGQADSVDYTKLSASEKALLQLRLKALLARYRWRNSGFYQVLNSNDPAIKKTLELIQGMH